MELSVFDNRLDLATLMFTFHYDLDLILSGLVFTDYTVDVTGTAGVNTPTPVPAVFNF